MTEMTAHVELDAPVRELTADRADIFMDRLGEFAPAVGGSAAGRIEIVLTVPDGADMGALADSVVDAVEEAGLDAAVADVRVGSAATD